ncbi:leucyl/phenylalanyl-tRNA--protein transferase [Chromatiales bacterium (ex Bugula neritina AB1)]|nr:leucyl/phenylalanyl-tRNA--protein transferase [Chromatiales bacterium (ex Bugula neritina AB1)]
MTEIPIPFLDANDDLTPFPRPENAMTEPNGLLMAGANLKPERLILAYRQGIFPWYSEGEPILWWSPDPRCIIWPEQIKVRRSLQKTIKKQQFTVSHNAAFGRVIENCGVPRQGSDGTWITADMTEAYCELARRGVAESIEVWSDDELVGGLYGVVVGRVFVGESMFSKKSDASKIALVTLATCGRFDLIDCQLPTEHLLNMGAVCISRTEYLSALKTLSR